MQPDKWVRRWRERMPDPVDARQDDDPLARLTRVAGDDGYDLVFVREPDDAPRTAPPGLLRIPLYTETMAVLAAKDHEITAFDEVAHADLAGERWVDPVDPLTATLDEVRAAVEMVAANVGLLVVPQPYARVLARRDVVVRPVTGVPATRMGVAWAAEREGDAAVDAFVGIVRGRTASSSRGADGPAPRDRAGENGGRAERDDRGRRADRGRGRRTSRRR